MDHLNSLSIVDRRIKEWKQRLIDLTRRNRLLYFRRTRSSNLIVSQPDAQRIFYRLVIQEKPWKFWIPPPEDKADKESHLDLLFNEETLLRNHSRARSVEPLVQILPPKNSPEIPTEESIREARKAFKDGEKAESARFLTKGGFTSSQIDTLFELFARERRQSVGQPSLRSQDIRPKRDELTCHGLSKNELERILKNLYRRANTDYRERGVRILYVAIGMLRWKEIEASDSVRSPLILCPVELKRKTVRDPFTLTLAGEDIVLNPALEVKLRKDFNVELPTLPESWEQGSVSEYLDSIRQVIPPSWQVEPTALVGLFSFHKLVMYQDLTVNASRVRAHPIVLALSGEPLEDNGVGEIPDERQLDSTQDPANTFQILDADSSQQVCIQAALRRQSLVLHGPPGTGKSQTIANIIAEFIARGKTVLFVSEKMAALEVVFKRLRDAGLGDFCLELHSHKANKRQVIAELRRCLDERVVPRHLPSRTDFKKLKRLREKLNDYVLALHMVREPLGRSAHDVLGDLAKLDAIPLLSITLEDAHHLRPGQMQKWDELMRRLVTVWQVAEEGENFPWFRCHETRFTLDVHNRWASLLDQLASALDQLMATSKRFSTDIGVDEPASLAEVDWIIQLGNQLACSPSPEASWLMACEIEDLLREAEKCETLNRDGQRIRTQLSEHYQDSFFKLPVGIRNQIKLAWENVAMLLTPSDSEGRSLLEQIQWLSQFIEYTILVVGDCLRDAAALGQYLGLTVEDVTLERLRELAELAQLCNSNIRPEADWLDPIRIDQIRDLIATIRPKYEEYNTRKRKLMPIYDETFLNLDLDQLIENFNSIFYRSFMRWLHPGFYRDKRAILRAAHTRTLPALVLEDLLEARELIRLRRQLDSNAGHVRRLLRAYDKGYDTDFNLVEKALKVAALAIKLAGIVPVPEGLVHAIGLGTVPPPDLLELGSRTLERLQKWEQGVQGLSALIPVNRLPTTGLPIMRSKLTKLGEWAQCLSSALRELSDLLDLVLPHRRADWPVDLSSLLADIECGEKLRLIQAHLSDESNPLHREFGPRYSGTDTDWQDLLATLEWTKKVRQLFDAQPMSKCFVEVAARGGGQAPSVEETTSIYQKTIGLLETLEGGFDAPEPTYCGRALRDLSLVELRDRIRILRERIDDLQDWIDFERIKKQLARAGLDNFLTQLQEAPPPSAKLIQVLRRSVYQAWINSIFEQDPRLGEFRGRHHEQLIREFREVDQILVRLSSQRIIERCNAGRPQHVFLQARDSEIAVLDREAAKRRRHLPVRRLFERIPNLLLRLKPCLLMSPLSVSQFLDPGLIGFNLVIFDEASQIFTEDAVGAIYRGSQLVVAGDNKQLPPTDFFKSLDNDEDSLDEDALDDQTSADFTSVLDECGTVLPRVILKWHYRSRHESLIAFSNQRFYDNRLITFPSSRREHETLGVEYVYVPDGVYDRGGKRDNIREVKVVTNRVFEHFERYPEKSIGVVAFSQAQMIAIEDEIERRRRASPEFERFFKDDRLEGFFVKNLENVQGDERDMIIFSIGYGRDKQSRITMNFGPLNKPGGERRLNVAVTRAREKVVVVSSIKASDFDLRATQATGVLNLYHYLDYAERGAVALELTHPQGQGESESPLEEDVAGEIRRLGYDVVPQVGCGGYRIDIGVVDPAEPGHFLLGVECDGASYHSAATARDRDRLRENVLRNLGWRIHRIWSPDWVGKRQSEVKRLKQAIEETRQGRLNFPEAGDTNDDSRPTGNQGATGVHLPVPQPQAEEPVPGTIRYHVWRFGSTWAGEEFHLPRCREEQCHLLTQIVRKEGPIHIELAARRLVTAWGLSRIGSRIMGTINEAVRRCERRKMLARRGEFLWPPRLSNPPVRTPLDDVPESFRDMRHIPPEEIHAAMLLIVGHAVGISAESLITETARLFGFNRTGERIRKRLSKGYKALLKKGILMENGNLVTLQK